MTKSAADRYCAAAHGVLEPGAGKLKIKRRLTTVDISTVAWQIKGPKDPSSTNALERRGTCQGKARLVGLRLTLHGSLKSLLRTNGKPRVGSTFNAAVRRDPTLEISAALPMQTDQRALRLFDQALSQAYVVRRIAAMEKRPSAVDSNCSGDRGTVCTIIVVSISNGSR